MSADDLGQHLLGIFAGDGGLGNAVEESELARAALLLGEQAGIFHGHRNLAGGGLHHFQIARLENVLALRVHRSHHAGGPAAEQDGRAAEALRRPRRHDR